MIDTSMLSLGQAQELYTRLDNKWVAWCLSQPGWELRHGEGCLLEAGADDRGRRARIVHWDDDHEKLVYGAEVMVVDRVHMVGSAHYLKLAKDWQLFVNGIHITRSEDPNWVRAGEKAEELGLSWGGRFNDGNHVSLNWRGVQ